MVSTCNSTCTSTNHDDIDICKFLFLQLNGVQECCCRNNCSAVLVVMHNRNIGCLRNSAFDFKALWCFDIFKINPSKGFGNIHYGLNKGFRIFSVDLYVKNINVGKRLEKKAFTLHYGLTRKGSNVS